jgi:hypothetical protein
LIFLSICSCGSKKKDESIEADAELMELAKSHEEKANEDLHALGGVDSLSLIAWGDTKFGMTKQEVMASKAFKGEKEKVKERGEDSYLMDYEKSNDLRRLYNLEYNPTIRAYFKENELYLVTIETYGRSADKIEDLANDCGIFAKEFMKKYGEPAYLRTNASILDFRNHQLKIASFSIGTKEIWIGLLEDDSEYKYYISIKNKSFPKKKHIPTEEELKKQKEQDKKNKELRDNSF